MPTWNYAVAHAHGTVRVIDDAAWLRAHLEALTAHNEAARDAPWRVDDAPRDYTDRLIGALVGIEMPIARLSGKWKVSQNQPADHRAGVARGLREEAGGAEALEMAVMIEQARPPHR